MTKQTALTYPLSPQAPPLILLIEDDPLIRRLMRHFLEETYQIVEVTNGRDGIDFYQRLHPALVLLDCMMPIMDGFECCAQLQSLPGADHTPVLMVTGLEDRASVDKAFAVGAADFVTKPIHWAVLRQRVRRLIQQAHLQQQLEAANQKLQLLATTDGLTQLANRRQFDHRLDHLWRLMAREEAPLSLILCDIDFFKHYNDANGHQAGDDCLRQVAKVIGASVKCPGDVVARYGGEEFALVLPNTSLGSAVEVAETIRVGVKALQLNHPHSITHQHVTLSAGVTSTFPHQLAQCPPEALIKAADTGLYEAKAAGRDRVCTHRLI
ncbi:MAG: diguanylate cyclase domain-containing protein [Stenomitos frigidus ULC029]